MGGSRGYDIFPRTFKARLLLAPAFLGGLAPIGGFVAAVFLVGELLPDPPCSGSRLPGCLEAQAELQPIAQDACAGFDRRVCVVPLGQISPALVRQLVEHYENQYGLTVTVLTPSAIPLSLANPDRGQIDSDTLIAYMGDLFPESYHDPSAVLIGLTPVDLYIEGRDWRYAFGSRGRFTNPKAVVSTSRMDPRYTSFSSDDELLFERARKLVSKYIGLLYYGLSPSDPHSPLYNDILGPRDLDRMEEPLPVPAGR